MRDQTGFFVFRVESQEGVTLHRFERGGIFVPTTTTRMLERHELVAVDTIRTIHDKQALRLVHSGLWVLNFSQNSLRQLETEPILKAFYVDNYPHGQSVLCHPCDRVENLTDVTLQPLQKVYCDLAVQDPGTAKTFYRIQGSYGSWITDKRTRPATAEQPRDELYLLLDEDKVQIRSCAFLTHQPIELRSEPDVGERSRTGRMVGKRELLVGNAIRTSPFGYQNGPFVHVLIDDTNNKRGAMGAWAFERKHSLRIMTELPVTFASHTMQVVADSVAMRRQPVRLQGNGAVDSTGSSAVLQIFPRNAIVECDASFEEPTGVVFYRVKGGGWIHDQWRGRTLLKPFQPVMSPGSSSVCTPFIAQTPPHMTAGRGWTLDFVRGLVASVDGIEESQCDAERLVLQCSQSDTPREIVVHYNTRTVDVLTPDLALNRRMSRLHNCTAKQLVEIFKNPSLVVHPVPPHYGSRGGVEESKEAVLIESMAGESKSANEEKGPESTDAAKEFKLRFELMECEFELAKTLERRLNLLDSIQELDQVNAEEAAERLGRLATEQVVPTSTFAFTNMMNHSPISRAIDFASFDEVTVESLPPSVHRLQNGTPDKSFQSRSYDKEADEGRQSSSDGEQMNRTCGVCGEHFPSARLRSVHCLEAHDKYSCNYCVAVFDTSQELHEHRDELDHW